MISVFYVMVVVTLGPAQTYTIEFARFDTIEECLQSASAIDAMTKSFTKCIKQEERID